MQVPNRFYNGSDYRYGFNGKEKDNEVKGDGNSIDYGLRMHDPRIGRFFAVDPLTKSFPHYSPYQFAGNTPIQAIDLDGAEEYHYLAYFDKNIGKIVFKLESGKTIKEKTFLGWSWIPKETHTVIYQSSDGDKSTFVFTASYIARLGAGFVIVNKVPDFRKFVKDSKTRAYGSEKEAESTLNSTFMSDEAQLMNDIGGAFVDYATSSEAFSIKPPIQKKASNIAQIKHTPSGSMQGKTIGHTFDKHGSHNTHALTMQAKNGKSPQGQWINDAIAEEFISKNLHLLKNGAKTIELPKGLGRVINPDGTITPATHVRLVPSGSGVKTAYPGTKETLPE